MNNWNYLKKGDLVEVIATAPGIAIETLEKDLNAVKNFLNSLGLASHIDAKKIAAGAAYFSNEAQAIRQLSLIEAFKNEQAKAIWCLRGGYGTSKLLPSLSQIVKPKHPKLLIGYSDINCLHLWLGKHYNWPSLHARVLYDFTSKQDHLDLESLKEIIFGVKEKVSYDQLIPLNKAAKTNQIIEAKITGGTLQVLQSGIGLPWQFDSSDKILFFEEIFDRGVRLDRTLNHFKELGLFKSAKAILFGDIICGSESNGQQHCDLAIGHFAANINIPVLSINSIGHGVLNYPLPLNTNSVLSLQGEKAILTCATGGKHER